MDWMNLIPCFSNYSLVCHRVNAEHNFFNTQELRSYSSSIVACDPEKLTFEVRVKSL